MIADVTFTPNPGDDDNAAYQRIASFVGWSTSKGKGHGKVPAGPREGRVRSDELALGTGQNARGEL